MITKALRLSSLFSSQQPLCASFLLAAGLLVACGGSSDVELGALAPESNAGNAGQSGASGAGQGGTSSAGGAGQGGTPSAGGAGASAGGAGASAGGAGASAAGSAGEGGSLAAGNAGNAGIAGQPQGGAAGTGGAGGAGGAGMSQGGAGTSAGAGGGVTLTACKVPTDFVSGDEEACDSPGSVKYSWNGTACAARLDGPFCACSGPDCALMFASFEACMDLNSACTSTVPSGKLVAAGDPVTVGTTLGVPVGMGNFHEGTPLLARINGLAETADPLVDLVVTGRPLLPGAPDPDGNPVFLRNLAPWGAWPPAMISDGVPIGMAADGVVIGQPDLHPHGTLLLPNLDGGIKFQSPLDSGKWSGPLGGKNAKALFVVEGHGKWFMGYQVETTIALLLMSPVVGGGPTAVTIEKMEFVACKSSSPTAAAARTEDGFLLAFSASSDGLGVCTPADSDTGAPATTLQIAHVALDGTLTPQGSPAQGSISSTKDGVTLLNTDVPVRQILLTPQGSGAWLSWTRNPYPDGSPTDWEDSLLGPQGAPLGFSRVWGEPLFSPHLAAARLGDGLILARIADYQSVGINSPTTITLSVTRGDSQNYPTVNAIVNFDDTVSKPTGSLAVLGSPDGRSVLLAWSEHQVQQTEPVPDVIKLQRFDCQASP